MYETGTVVHTFLEGEGKSLLGKFTRFVSTENKKQLGCERKV